MKLVEIAEPKWETEITAIVKAVAADHGFPDMTVESRKHGDWFEIIIGSQSMTVKVDADGTLHLANVYVPEELRGKGFLTDVLKKIRKLNGLNGNCRVHVAMNPAWEKIIERSGFARVKPE